MLGKRVDVRVPHSPNLVDYSHDSFVQMSSTNISTISSSSSLLHLHAIDTHTHTHTHFSSPSSSSHRHTHTHTHTHTILIISSIFFFTTTIAMSFKLMVDSLLSLKTPCTFMKINLHLPFYQTLYQFDDQALSRVFPPLYMLQPWEKRKVGSCSWLFCFHDSKNFEVGSSNPRFTSSNSLHLCHI